MLYSAYRFLLWAGVVGLVVGLYALLPSATAYPLPPEVASSFTLVSGYMRSLDFILPVSTAFGLLVFILFFEVLVFLYNRALWLIKLIIQG